MDLLALPARWLSGAVARVLDVEGRTREQRRAEVVRSMTSAAADAHDLWLRHLTRATMWGIMLAFAFPAWVLLTFGTALATGDGDTAILDGAITAGAFIAFFVFFMACIHFLKALVATYFLENRWDRRRRWWRAVMLAQTPDVIVAVTLAAVAAS
ncbi:MAG TPA: hypothetical protein VNV66_13975 [Pilimelia sp.]|nr:hypothetical protein [Pilimelia sp.]